jgi:hypothetical protein
VALEKIVGLVLSASVHRLVIAYFDLQFRALNANNERAITYAHAVHFGAKLCSNLANEEAIGKLAPARKRGEFVFDVVD